MNIGILAYPLAAAVGAIVGSLTHEAVHAIAASALGQLEGVGWQGGLAGGPYVDYRVETRWQSEVVRKAPLAIGAVAAILVVLTYEGPTVQWVTAAAAVAGLLWTSPEDLFVGAAERSAAEH